MGTESLKSKTTHSQVVVSAPATILNFYALPSLQEGRQHHQSQCYTAASLPGGFVLS